MSDMNDKIMDEVRGAVEAGGLVFLGVARLQPDAVATGRLAAWLSEGRHAGMTYLEAHASLRADPGKLLAGARSVVVVGLPYYQGDRLRQPGPRIAQYARLRDYHKVLWQRGEQALTRLHERLGPGSVGRVITDSAPLLERAVAARTGSGFIGKNTCFIRPKEGSFLLLGELLTSLDLPLTNGPEVDPTRRTETGGCGGCKRCQVHCPTGALSRDFSLDARLCLSYWTIEHRGTIPERFWPWLKVYVFGCDICQLVCPYNRQAVLAPIADLARVEARPDLFEMATMTQETYERRFGGTPLTRAKRTGLMRNALIALTVTGDSRLDAALPLAAALGDVVVRDTIDQISRWRRGLS